LLLLDQAKEISKGNEAKRAGLLSKMQSLGTFAKQHPWLTAGFLVAMILVICTAYFTVEALLGHTTVNLFMVHPEIGGGLSFMGIYYSVYLINMCRRAKVKDDLEARVQAHNQLNDELGKSKSADVKILTAEMNRGVSDMKKTLMSTEMHLRRTFEDQKKRVENAQKNLTIIQAKKRSFEDLLVTKKNLSEEAKRQLIDAITTASQAIEAGARLVLTKVASAESRPEIPFLVLETGEISFPPLQTEEMKNNQEKQKRAVGKIKTALEGLQAYLIQNPASRMMWITGLAMCLLAGVALAFYFRGATSIYFFGELSLAAIVSMVIYGVSLIYEAYNNTTIERLKDELKKIEITNEQRRQSIQNELEKLDSIRQSAQKTFVDFAQNWNTFLNLEVSQLTQNLDELRSVEEKNNTVFNKFADTLFSIFSEISKDVTQADTRRAVSVLEMGPTVSLPKDLQSKVSSTQYV
jgi:hypothetical protein